MAPPRRRARSTVTAGDAHAEKEGHVPHRVAMGAPYVATASVGYLDDYATKVEKASHIHGTKFIHVLLHARPGGGKPGRRDGGAAREAVDCGSVAAGGMRGRRGDWSTATQRKKTGEFAPVEQSPPRSGASST